MLFPSLQGYLLFFACTCIALGAVLEQNENGKLWESLATELDIEAVHLKGGGAPGSETPFQPGLLQEKEITNGFPSAMTKPRKKTVLLLDGEATSSQHIPFTLPSFESIKSIVHVVNDSSIITSHSHSVESNKLTSGSSYNITLVHEFEGNVGVANFLVQVLTSKNRYVFYGTFYVAGIVIRIPGTTSSKGIISGMGSQGLSFKDPSKVSINSTLGQVPLKIEYQPVGPDVSENPPSLQEVLKSSKVSIKNSDNGVETPLINYSPKECQSIQNIMLANSGSFVFLEGNCGIGYEEGAKTLVLSINRERSGTAAIMIYLPGLIFEGEEFETSINVFVGEPKTVKPVVIVPPNFHLVLDQYAAEEFELEMYNTLTPSQRSNASIYIMDLPGKRYAESLLSRSKLIHPIQVIKFKTIPSGSENPEVLQLIEDSLNSGGPVPSPESDIMKEYQVSPVPDVRFTEDLDELSQSLELEKGSPLISSPEYRRAGQVALLGVRKKDSFKLLQNSVDKNSQPSHESAVYVQFPPNNFFTEAVSNTYQPLTSTFASGKLAQIRGTQGDVEKENVEVRVKLDGFSIGTFSEHKSEQIRRTIVANALLKEENATVEASLVALSDIDESLVATYNLRVSGKGAMIASGLSDDKALPQEIEKAALLGTDTVSEITARRVPASELPSNVNGSPDAASVSALPTGPIIFAVVVLSFIIAIPLFTFCFGYMAIRRHEQSEGASNFTSADTTAAAVDANSTAADRSLDSAATPEIARDTFGRPEEVEDNSYKMERELFRDGYFGDNSPGPSSSSAK